jgi:hypothetical protein
MPRWGRSKPTGATCAPPGSGPWRSRAADLLQSICDSAFWWCQWSNRYIEGKALFELAING